MKRIICQTFLPDCCPLDVNVSAKLLLPAHMVTRECSCCQVENLFTFCDKPPHIYALQNHRFLQVSMFCFKKSRSFIVKNKANSRYEILFATYSIYTTENGKIKIAKNTIKNKYRKQKSLKSNKINIKKVHCALRKCTMGALSCGAQRRLVKIVKS